MGVEAVDRLTKTQMRVWRSGCAGRAEVAFAARRAAIELTAKA